MCMEKNFYWFDVWLDRKFVNKEKDYKLNVFVIICFKMVYNYVVMVYKLIVVNVCVIGIYL